MVTNTAQGMPEPEQDAVARIRHADAQYRSFPSFSEWLARTLVNLDEWRPYREKIAVLKHQPEERLARALDIVRRTAAVDTGAIEGLYETGRGFTFTVAAQTAHWEQDLEKKGPKTKAMIEAQISAYDHVLDFATQRQPIVEAWIRSLHERICAGQDVYEVKTAIGWQEQPLPKGTYKTQPNHVELPDGTIHSYAPVDSTAHEMHRYVLELHGPEFSEADSLLQASYAHHALSVIHPFADGNGRVARALASVFTLRAASVPVLVLFGDRDDYLAALRNADSGDYQRFVDFVFSRVKEAVRLAEESLLAAGRPQLPDILPDLEKLYVTQGGYRHEDVDRAGLRLFELFLEELRTQLKELSASGTLQVNIEALDGAYPARDATYRTLAQPKRIRVRLTTAPPAHTRKEVVFGVEVPKDCGPEDALQIVELAESPEAFRATVPELVPSPTSALRIRVQLGVERMLTRPLSETVTAAAQAINRKYPR